MPTASVAPRLEQRLGAKLRAELESRAAPATKDGDTAALTHPGAKAEALYRDGVQQARAGRPKEAIATLSRAIFLIPNEPLPYVARGEAFAAVCDLKSAISNFRKAQTLLRDPAVAEDVRTRLSHIIDAMGVVYLRRGEPRRALQYFESAKAEHDEPVFSLHVCLALIALGRAHEAEVALTALLNVSSAADDKQRARAAKREQARKERERKASSSQRLGASSMDDGSPGAASSARAGDDSDASDVESSDGEEDEDEETAEARRALVRAQAAVDADARVLLVHLAIKSGDFARARQLLESALERHYTHPRVQDMERRFDETFQRLRETSEAALDVAGLTRCISCFPDDAELFRTRALAYIQLKQYTRAVQDLFSCLQKSGGTNPVASALMASTLGTVADELAEAEDYVAAVNYYGEALKWDATTPDVYIARGDCHVQLGRHEQALLDYKNALSLDPTSDLVRRRLARLHDTWGMVLYNQARYELAITEFTRAIGYDDRDPAYPYHRALTRVMLKDQLGAARDLLTCRSLGATDPAIVKLVAQVCGPAKPGAAGVQGAGSGTGALIPHPGSEARAARKDHRRTLGARLGLPLHAATILRSVQGDLVGDVVTAETDVTTLRDDRDALLRQHYNPAVIRDAARAKPAAAVVKKSPGDGAPQLASSSSTPGAAQPGTLANGTPAPLASRANATASAPPKRGEQRQSTRVWAGAAAITASRLDRVQVSKASEVPKAYVEQRQGRENRLHEEHLREQLAERQAIRDRVAAAQSGVPVPPPPAVAKAKAQRARLQPRSVANAPAMTGDLDGLLRQQAARLDVRTTAFGHDVKSRAR